MRDLRDIDTQSSVQHGWLSRRMLNGLGFLICAAGLGFAYYVQHFQGFEPCPLCIFQRLALLLVGLIFLVAAVHAPRGWGAKGYGIMIGLAAGVGTAIAARHVWLQHLPPDQVPLCGPSLEYMLQAFPLNETLREVLTGSGECARVDWTMLGFSMPEWTLSLFIVLGVAGVIGNWRLRR